MKNRVEQREGNERPFRLGMLWRKVALASLAATAMVGTVLSGSDLRAQSGELVLYCSVDELATLVQLFGEEEASALPRAGRCLPAGIY